MLKVWSKVRFTYPTYFDHDSIVSNIFDVWIQGFCLLCAAVSAALFLDDIIASLFMPFWVVVYIRPAALFAKDFNLGRLARVSGDLFIYSGFTWTFDSWTVINPKILANKGINLLFTFVVFKHLGGIWFSKLLPFFLTSCCRVCKIKIYLRILDEITSSRSVGLSSVLCSEVPEDCGFKFWGQASRKELLSLSSKILFMARFEFQMLGLYRISFSSGILIETIPDPFAAWIALKTSRASACCWI